MAKYVCSICGYTHEGAIRPDKCPACLASASEFSEIKEAKVEGDVNKDEAIDVIDGSENNNSPQMTVVVNNEVDKNCNEDNSNKEEGDVCKIDDATNKDHLDNDCPLDPDEEAIINQITVTHGALLQVVKWYKDEKGVSLKEAKDKVESVLIKHNLRNANRGGSGCVVTILVAISSTLSLLYFL